jgi:hypothetical protein
MQIYNGARRLRLAHPVLEIDDTHNGRKGEQGNCDVEHIGLFME